MKKLFTLLLICFLALNMAQAQKFYARIGLGGGISTSSSFDMLYKYENDGTSKTISVVPVGLGTGFNGSVSFGYMFSKYIGIDLTVGEFIGLPTTGDSVVHLMGGTQANIKLVGYLFSITPGVVISAGLDKVNPYARFGLQIGALPIMLARYSSENASVNPPATTKMTNGYYGGVALGYTATGGCEFNINKLINLFVELTFAHSTWSPSYSEIIEYTVNGQDKLSTLTVHQKQTDFRDKIRVNATTSDDTPKQALRKTVPFSTASVNFGIKFKFGRSK
jgi:hypothetical protein